jgi:hypothetical protein
MSAYFSRDGDFTVGHGQSIVRHYPHFYGQSPLDKIKWPISFISIMKWKLVIPIVVIVLLGIVFRPVSVYRLFHPPTEQDVIQKIFTSRQIYDVVMTSPQVTAQVLKNDPENGFPILARDNKYKPVMLSPGQAQKLEELLGKPSSYTWDVISGCTPHYGVVFDFRSGGHTVRVAFCFECRAMGVFDGEGENAKEITDFVLFDPMRKQLTALCKALFPDDPKIQALK